MAERSKAAALKPAKRDKRFQGSNPCPSAEETRWENEGGAVKIDLTPAEKPDTLKA